MPRICLLFLQCKQWLGFFLSALMCIWGGAHFCAKNVLIALLNYIVVKDNNRKSKVFLTGTPVSSVLVSQAVIFTVFISAAGLMLCNCY